MLKPAAQAAHETQYDQQREHRRKRHPHQPDRHPHIARHQQPKLAHPLRNEARRYLQYRRRAAESRPQQSNLRERQPHIALDQRQYREQQRKMQIAPNVHHRAEVQRAPRARSPRNVITRNARNSHNIINIINILKHNAADYTTIANQSSAQTAAPHYALEEKPILPPFDCWRYNNRAVEVGEIEVRSSAANRDCATAYPKQYQRGQPLSLPQTDVRECRIDTRDKGTGDMRYKGVSAKVRRLQRRACVGSLRRAGRCS